MATEQMVTVDTLKAIADAFNRHDLDAIMERIATGSPEIWESPNGR